MRTRLLVLLMGLFLNSYAQKEAYNWYFGKYAAINFSTGAPVSLTGSAMYASNGSASVSDSAGNLLFYSNGVKVWNRNHVVMQNGTGLKGNTLSAQAAVAIKEPGSENRYYLFTVTASYFDDDFGLYYSVIDMSLNGGLGGILPGEKNILLPGSEFVSDAIGAVATGDGEGYWIFVRSSTAESRILAYRLDETGVNPAPVVSPTQYNYQNFWTNAGIKISADGRYMAYMGLTEWMTDRTAELYRIDNNTGQVIPVFLFDQLNTALGVEFSPNGEFLYIASHFNSESRIYQYDMSQLSDATAFENSRYLVGRSMYPENPEYYQCQLAPDGKIYIAQQFGQPIEKPYLAAINKPSKKGAACDFNSNAVELIEGVCVFGLPTIVQSYMLRYSYKGQCFGGETSFTSNFNPVPDSIEWEFGDPASGAQNFSNEINPVHVFSDTGTYNVRATVFYENGHEEEAIRVVKIYPLPDVDLGADLSICPGDVVTLDAGAGFRSYLWSTGQEVQSIAVSDTGTYCVEVSSVQGCVNTDCVTVNRHPAPVINETNLNLAPTTCGGSTGAISGLALEGGTLPLALEWKDGNGQSYGSTLDIDHLPVENYILYITDAGGCTWPSRNYNIGDVGDVLIDTVYFAHSHCDQPDGSITVQATTGLAAMLVYSIDNGATYHDNLGEFTGLPEGEYKVRVKINDPLQPCQKVFDFNPIRITDLPSPEILDVSTESETEEQGGKIIIAAQGTGDTLIYSVGGIEQINDGTFENLQANTYTCVVRDMYGCDTAFEVKVEKLIVIKLEALIDDGSACLGNIGVIPLLVNNFSDVGSFDVHLKYDNQKVECENYLNPDPFLGDSLEIFLYPETGELNLRWTGQYSLYLPDGSTLVELSFVSKEAGHSPVEWDMSPGRSVFLDSESNTLKSDLQPGMLRIYSIPSASVAETVTVCEDDDIALIAVHEPGTGNGTISYKWKGPGSFMSNDSTVQIEGAGIHNAGDYMVSISDTNHCRNEYTVRVNVVQKPEVNFENTIYFEEEAILEAPQGYASYLWNTGESTYYITVTKEGEYSVIVNTSEGCESKDTVMMVDVATPVQVPNAFTPNGDGLNDTFKPLIRNADQVVNYHMAIYNRWGQLIFESTTPSKGWNGDNSPGGVYNWIINFTNQIGKAFSLKGEALLLK